jgi:DNA-binding response OmpR family regulator
MKKEPAVLLVEDEPLLGELMTEALIDQGFEVHAAPDANDALRYLVSGAQVDILFTDVDLGGGMDGAELAQLAREMRPKLPIVYTSGRRLPDRVAAVPGAAFLSKPYSLDDVSATLGQMMRNSASH